MSKNNQPNISDPESEIKIASGDFLPLLRFVRGQWDVISYPLLVIVGMATLVALMTILVW